MTQKCSPLALTFTIIMLLSAACAAPVRIPPTTVPSTSTPIPTDTPVPTPGTLPNCERAAGRVQQACTSPETGLHYWAYVPSDSANSPAGLPLLVYLHGFGHSGSNLDLILTGGVSAEIEKGRTPALMVVSPQCPFSDNWQSVEMVERLSRFVDEMVDTYQADPDRVYLTGFSMGGDGVWAVGQAHPQQFAALLPVASDWYPRDPTAMCVLRDTPIWVFQSEKDEVVSPKYAKNNVDSIQRCGGAEIQLTLFSTGWHEQTSQQVYAMAEIYEWLLKQK